MDIPGQEIHHRLPAVQKHRLGRFVDRLPEPANCGARSRQRPHPTGQQRDGNCPVSIDEIIEVYKRDVDVTLLLASLQRTVEERILALEEFGRFREELRPITSRRRPHK